MKFSDLNPKYGETKGIRTHIIFEAPGCGHENKCMIVIPFAGESLCKWQLSASQPVSEMFKEPSFDQVTLHPSIWFNKGGKNPTVCDVHFFVRNGEIIYA